MHWWSLRLPCLIAFWLTGQLQWNSKVTAPAQVIAIRFACFMVICCINAQARQPFYRYNCLGRLLRCFFHMCLCPSAYHDELTMTYLKCYPQSWVHSLSNSHANRVFVIISTVTEQISMEYARIRRKTYSFWSKGKMKVALESANSCDQQVFWAKSSYSMNTWTNTTAYAKKGVHNLYF